MPRDAFTDDFFQSPDASHQSTNAYSIDDSSSLPRSVGATLRHRREQLGMTLEECQQRTRIRLAFLAAVEEDKLEDLPPDRTTVRSYVRSYAKLLELDDTELIQKFNEMHFPHVAVKVTRGPKPLPSLPTNTILFLAIALLLIVVLIGIMQSFLSQPEENITVELPPPPITKSRELASLETLPSLETSDMVEELKETQIVSVNPPSETSEPSVLKALRVSHNEQLWVKIRRTEGERTIQDLILLEPAEPLHFILEQGSSLHIPTSHEVMLMLIDQHDKVAAEVPYQAIADNKGWIHFETLTQQ